ncbi:MAG: UTP--glucose-1-phosphate uridylyltransferase [Sulfurimonas sp.]|nr:UTP--glucose-1-phosphate uridylyltransferase [Sulfurimonas sp.]MDD5201856.1 UTP--glucose-1-phosphate uridylyltransferase [Sulfurimonas sp.]
MSQIRYDRLRDAHVIIAPERLHRPDCDIQIKERRREKKVCPFCEGNEAMTPPEIFAKRSFESFANEKGWQTRVVPNLYKALQIETPHEHHFGHFEHWEGFGAHEVIIDTPQHHTSMTQWSEANVIAWLQTLRSRVADLRRDHRISYISLFKNQGEAAGSTQEHSHTQLIGLPLIPKAQKEEYKNAYIHYKHHKRSLFEELLAHEEKEAIRMVDSEGDFSAYCPYASAYPFEVVLSSKKALGQIDRLSDASIKELAPLLLRVLKKLKVQLSCLDFNLALFTPPLQESGFESELFASVDEVYRFSIRIMPRIYKFGGFEGSTGIIINPVAPEQAAKLLRESNHV